MMLLCCSYQASSCSGRVVAMAVNSPHIPSVTSICPLLWEFHRNMGHTLAQRGAMDPLLHDEHKNPTLIGHLRSTQSQSTWKFDRFDRRGNVFERGLYIIAISLLESCRVLYRLVTLTRSFRRQSVEWPYIWVRRRRPPDPFPASTREAPPPAAALISGVDDWPRTTPPMLPLMRMFGMGPTCEVPERVASAAACRGRHEAGKGESGRR